METKFLILRSNACNGYWSYMSLPKDFNEYKPIVGTFEDRFLNTGVEQAQQFDTYEEAENFLKGLGMVHAIFKIEKIFIVS